MPLSVLSELKTGRGIGEVEEGRNQKGNHGQLPSMSGTLTDLRVTGVHTSPQLTFSVLQGRAQQAVSIDLHTDSQHPPLTLRTVEKS